ncbi:hypothetical protein MXB_5096, partial [Myxobolus squamalis]
LSKLYRLTEIAATDLEFAKLGLIFFKSVEETESPFILGNKDSSDDLIQMEKEVKELLDDIYSMYRTIKNIGDFVSLFSILLETSEYQFQTCQNIHQGLQDIFNFIEKCQTALISPPKTTSTQVIKNKLITSLLMEYCKLPTLHI